MSHGRHTYVMLGLVAVGGILLLAGDGSGWVYWLWPLACMAMMVAMMWGMGGSGRRTGRPVEHTHGDGITHVHQ